MKKIQSAEDSEEDSAKLLKTLPEALIKKGTWHLAYFKATHDQYEFWV